MSVFDHIRTSGQWRDFLGTWFILPRHFKTFIELNIRFAHWRIKWHHCWPFYLPSIRPSLLLGTESSKYEISCWEANFVFNFFYYLFHLCMKTVLLQYIKINGKLFFGSLHSGSSQIDLAANDLVTWMNTSRLLSIYTVIYYCAAHHVFCWPHMSCARFGQFINGYPFTPHTW